jgi:hypothetical protein
MNKKTVLRITNILIAVLILNQATTAALSDMIGSEAFEFIHETGGALLLAGVAIHVILNWGWVKSTLFNKG